MLTNKVNLSQKVGDVLRLEFAVTDQDNVPANILGATVRFGLAKSRTSPLLLSTHPPLSNVTVLITDAPAGIFQVTASTQTTLTLAEGTYYYECEIADGGGEKSTLAAGLFYFEPALIP